MVIPRGRWAPGNWSLRARVFLFFAFIGFGTIAIDVALMVAAARWINDGRPVTSTLVLFGGAAGLATLGLTVWVWAKFDEHIVRAVQVISASLRSVAHSASSRGLNSAAGRYLGTLAPAVHEATTALKDARAQIKRAAEDATTDLQVRLRRLESVLQDIDQGVIICSLRHEILLYNPKALDILHVSGELGLGRSLTALVSARPLEQALTRVRQRLVDSRSIGADAEPSTLFVATTADGRATLKGRLSLTLDVDGKVPIGYAVAFEDVTHELAAGVDRDRLLHKTTEDLRRRVANLIWMGEVLLRDRSLSEDEAMALGSSADEVFAAERGELEGDLRKLEQASTDLLASAWPTVAAFVPTLLNLSAMSHAERTGLTCHVDTEPFWINCDPGSLSDLIDHIVNHLESGDVPPEGVRVRLEARHEPREDASLNIVVDGRIVPISQVEAWLDEPLDPASGDVTGRDVLFRHRSTLWPERLSPKGTRLRISVTPTAAPVIRAAARTARPEFYDFDLTAAVDRSEIDDRPLRSLAYVVFDTETTGLEPNRGDQIVSIAGVRVVNGRRMSGETFHALVRPTRRIPAASTRIHGIDDAMVADADPIEQVLPRFVAFADGAVLVAHNAAFDMSFLTQHAEGAPLATRPILDTVLLGAHVFGTSESLTLDTMADRFSIVIPSEERHTALGDSIATADVLIALFGPLQAAGAGTLRTAIEASNSQAALRRQQAKYASRQ